MSISLASICFAQGNSIPKSKEAKAQEIKDPEALPEGVKYRYKTFNGLNVSVNIFDPVMELMTWDHANYEATVTADIHHRFMPQVSVGLGHCDQLSDDEVRFKTKMSPFFKVGIIYNFKYNDTNPLFYYYVLARYGCSKSTADISNLTYTDGYWDEYGPTSIKSQDYKCHWLEIGGGIKTHITGPISMGWELTFRPMLTCGDDKNGKPYFAPGYGASKLNFAFNLYYDIFK